MSLVQKERVSKHSQETEAVETYAGYASTSKFFLKTFYLKLSFSCYQTLLLIATTLWTLLMLSLISKLTTKTLRRHVCSQQLSTISRQE